MTLTPQGVNDRKQIFFLYVANCKRNNTSVVKVFLFMFFGVIWTAE